MTTHPVLALMVAFPGGIVIIFLKEPQTTIILLLQETFQFLFLHMWFGPIELEGLQKIEV
jgi:hypothetical protein